MASDAWDALSKPDQAQAVTDFFAVFDRIMEMELRPEVVMRPFFKKRGFND